jgi:hypothetical protein
VPSGLPITEFNSACTQAVQPVPTGSWRGANRGSDVPPEWVAREPIGFRRGADGIFAPEALDSAKAAKLGLGSASKRRKQPLTRPGYPQIGHSEGRVCAGLLPAIAVACTMAIDPDELVILTNHGTMKLSSAVARTMILPPKERKRATIVREGTSAVLKFEQIKDLAAQWELVPSH